STMARQRVLSDRLRRLYHLWAALDEAFISTGGALHPEGWCPWNSSRAEIRAAWDALTHPDNLADLGDWLARGDDGAGMTDFAREPTLKAIEMCRSRAARRP